MPKQVLIAFLVVVLATFMPGVQIAATFNPERVRILDKQGTSILVRGNVPLNRYGEMDVNIVLERLQKNFGKDITKLYIVSLISSQQSDERTILLKQTSFFDLTYNKNVGHNMVHRPIVGSWLAPPPLGKANFLNELIWRLWRTDDGAWGMAEDLYNLLQALNNTAVYIHCMRGIDRTGLVAGTYLARWSNITSEEIHHLNREIGNRELNWPARNSLRWSIWKAESAIEI